MTSDVLLRAGFLALLPHFFLAPVYWRVLRPQLLPAARRLAYFLWGCQLLLLLFHGMTVGQTFQFSRFLWHFNGEFNIPTSFATLQLALVASQALTLTWAIRPRVEWRYWLGVSAFFFLLAIDEHTLLHEFGDATELFYLLYGILLTGFTWRWLVRKDGPEYGRLCRWVIFGLAISTMGAVVMDRIAPFCPAVDEVCAPYYLLEEVLEYSGILVVAVVVQGVALRALPEARWPAFGRRTIVTLGLVALVVYGAGRVIFPISERAFLPYRPPILSLSSASVERLTAGETATVRVDLVAMQELPAPLGYSLQLIDPLNGEVLASVDRWSKRRPERWPVEEVVAQELTLHIPEDAPVNRVLWLAMSLWWHGGVNFSPLSLDAGEWQQVTETLVKISEVILQAPTVEEMEDVGNTFATGFTLLRADYPTTARAGKNLRSPSIGKRKRLGKKIGNSSCISPMKKAARSGITTSRRWARVCPRGSGMRGWWITNAGNSFCQPICRRAATSC